MPALLCALLGFAVVVQVRSTQDAGLDGLRQTDLVRILDDVTERSNRLQTEARDLEDTRARVTNGSTGSRAALEEAQARAQVLGILAGPCPRPAPASSSPSATRPARSAPRCCSTPCRSCATRVPRRSRSPRWTGRPSGWWRPPRSRRRPAGGGAGGAGRVVVDGTELTSPYRFRVIGDSRTLAAALDIPGGVLDVLRQDDAQGVVTQRDRVTITSLRAAPSPRYARPARLD